MADLHAQGCTGDEIAERRNPAPSTVNNHLGGIFKKPQVNGKLPLATALQGSGARGTAGPQTASFAAGQIGAYLRWLREKNGYKPTQGWEDGKTTLA